MAMLCNIEGRTDHLGQVFESKKKMCEYWGVKLSTYDNRRREGRSKKYALTEKSNWDIEYRTDHLGQVFETKEKMCKHWNVSVSAYNKRRNDGLSKEDALTKKSYRIIEGRTDHLGQVFENQEKMCEHYGISTATYYIRRNDGLSKEDALTKNQNRIIEGRTDHLGQVFENKEKMCEHYGISTATYYRRKNNGLSKEDALTLPTSVYNKYRDPITSEISNLKQLSIKYGIDYVKLVGRITRYNIIRSLEISVMIRSCKANVNIKKYNLLINKRIKKGKDVFECYIDNGNGTSTFKIMSYDMIDQYCLEQYKIHNNII